SVRTPLVIGPQEREGTVPGRTSTPPTAPRRPCFSHVSIITVGRRPFLNPCVLDLRHPCLFDESCDLFSTSGVVLFYVRTMAECQNVLLLCPLTLLMVLQKEHHFGAKQDLMGDGRGDRDGCVRRGGPDAVGGFI
ncbi:hypothetical protein GOODEAATRI_001679, partial [Goodea atripinnis]